LLSQAVPARLVFDGRFLPRGPVQVSVVDEIKGLEFDYVVVPDASADDWPDDAAARRALYVAITRARQQVVFACTRAPTPLLRPAGAHRAAPTALARVGAGADVPWLR
jgi:superfamily I DNA/RNA helicase